jgi:hypothetical protein
MSGVTHCSVTDGPEYPTVSTVIARRLSTLLALEGGFTVDPTTGRRLGGGIAVCVDPRPSESFRRRDWTDGRIARWLFDASPHLARPGRFAGGWLEPSSGRVCLDVVAVLPPSRLYAALRAGRLAGQRSVFDLDRRLLVPIPRPPS